MRGRRETRQSSGRRSGQPRLKAPRAGMTRCATLGVRRWFWGDSGSRDFVLGGDLGFRAEGSGLGPPRLKAASAERVRFSLSLYLSPPPSLLPLPLSLSLAYSLSLAMSRCLSLLR